MPCPHASRSPAVGTPGVARAKPSWRRSDHGGASRHPPGRPQDPGKLADRRTGRHDIVHNDHPSASKQGLRTHPDGHRTPQIGLPGHESKAGLIRHPPAVPKRRDEGAVEPCPAQRHAGAAGDAQQRVLPAPPNGPRTGRRRHERRLKIRGSTAAGRWIEPHRDRRRKRVTERAGQGQPTALLVGQHGVTHRSAVHARRSDWNAAGPSRQHSSRLLELCATGRAEQAWRTGAPSADAAKSEVGRCRGELPPPDPQIHRLSVSDVAVPANTFLMDCAQLRRRPDGSRHGCSDTPGVTPATQPG